MALNGDTKKKKNIKTHHLELLLQTDLNFAKFLAMWDANRIEFGPVMAKVSSQNSQYLSKPY